MQTVRRLWAICISVGLVLLSAFPSALAVNTEGWYSSLVLPSFALSGDWQTPLWAVVYLADVAAFTSLFSKGTQGLRLYLPVAAGALNVFWCYAFFRLNSLIAASIVLGIIVVWTCACAALNFRKDKFAFALFFLKTLWFVYLFVVVVAIRQ